MENTLSASTCPFFHDHGYVIFKDAFSPTEVKDLQPWTQDIHDWPVRDDATYMPYEEIDLLGNRVLCRTENFADAHTGWSKLLKTGKLPHFLKQLAGQDMLLVKEKINYKFPGAGGYAPHLDAQAYTHTKDVQHLTVMLAIDSCGVENGCLEIVDGSHRMNVLIGEINCLTPKWIESSTWMPIPLEAGEILMFTSYVAHRSQTNTSSKSRRALYATYNVASDGDLRKEYYAERAREWPATHKMQKDNKYAAGASIHAMGTPMMSVLQGKALSVDDSCYVDYSMSANGLRKEKGTLGEP